MTFRNFVFASRHPVESGRNPEVQAWGFRWSLLFIWNLRGSGRDCFGYKELLPIQVFGCNPGFQPGKGNPISWAREVGKPGSIFAHPRALIRMWSSSRRIDTQWKKYDDGRFFLFSLEDLSRLKHAITNVDAWKIIRSIKPYIHRSIGTSRRPSVTENQWMRHSSEQ